MLQQLQVLHNGSRIVELLPPLDYLVVETPNPLITYDPKFSNVFSLPISDIVKMGVHVRAVPNVGSTEYVGSGDLQFVHFFSLKTFHAQRRPFENVSEEEIVLRKHESIVASLCEDFGIPVFSKRSEKNAGCWINTPEGSKRVSSSNIGFMVWKGSIVGRCVTTLHVKNDERKKMIKNDDSTTIEQATGIVQDSEMIKERCIDGLKSVFGY